MWGTELSYCWEVWRGTTFLEGSWQHVFEMHIYSDHKLYL